MVNQETISEVVKKKYLKCNDREETEIKIKNSLQDDSLISNRLPVTNKYEYVLDHGQLTITTA